MTRRWPVFTPMTLMLGVALSACSDGSSADLQASSACTVVRDPADRLACFDRAMATLDAVAGAAMNPHPTSAKPVETTAVPAEPLPPIVGLIEQLESDRKAGEHGARARDYGAEGTEGHRRYVISAPAQGAAQAWLAISCIETISRLQLVLAAPVADAQARIALSLDGRPVTSEQRWQVLGQGRVIDAGRGLVAIDTLRRIGDGEQLRVSSDLPVLDGLSFDATRLHARIAEQRKACRW